MNTTISITTENKKWLQTKRKHPRETYNDTLNNLKKQEKEKVKE